MRYCSILDKIQTNKVDSIKDYISKQLPGRQDILTVIHSIITDKDKTITATIESMMGKEMIMYKAKGMMKYALSSVKNYMSLHCLPIYMNSPLHAKYQALLPCASFQKGCINFKNDTEMPLDVTRQLITDCAPIDLVAIREKYLSDRKKSKAGK